MNILWKTPIHTYRHSPKNFLILQVMRLKSLEIKGFKSFANETVINFNEDIIGIVGPNGSGKSNIVDAIRWVLGEQKSKELRLEKMSNVIFNGTKKKKRAGMASVSLTFENTKNLLPTEYQEVSVTRCLYQSGESEYKLNGITCRLKDIRTLFLDTGIGSNSYAIIALGMVDDLLNDKENSRRKMFEQAAGISKYKIRKRETLNKLSSTSDDLDRIEDLLFEIENQLKALEKQAKRTKRYYELKEKYKELSVELAAFKLVNYKESHSQITKKLQEEEDRFRQLEIDSHQLEAKLEEEKKANVDKEQLLSERQRTLNTLVGEIRTKENDKNIMTQKVNFITQNQAKLIEQIRSATDRAVQLNDSIENYRLQLNDEKILEEELEEKLEKAQTELNEIKDSHGNIKSELDEVMQAQQSLEREVFELEKQRAINSNQVENLEKDIEASSSGIESRKTEVSQIEAQLKDHESRRQLKAKDLDTLERAEAQRQEDIVSVETKIEEWRKKISEVNRQLDAKRNEYKLTKSMVDNLEGFPESIKFLNKHKDWDKNTPILSDLIYVQEGYRVAIENYLSPYLNYYVVPNMKAAYDAVQLLGKAQKGKANFFVLDAFTDYEPPVKLVPNTQMAIDLVEVDQPYRKLFNHLLEGVLIQENDEIADGVADENTVLLSKSGRFVQRKFSLSGGSVGLFEGKKIGRKKNLEVLEVQIRKLEKEETKLSSEFYNLRTELDKLKSGIQSEAINREREALSQLAQQKVSLLTRLENFENFLRDADEKNKKSKDTIDLLKIANDKMDKELKMRTEALQKAKDQISNTDESYRQVAEQLSLASADYNAKNIEFVRQQNKTSAIQQELSFRIKQQEETEYNLQKDKQGQESGDIELVEIRAQIEELEAKLLGQYDLKKEQEQSLTEAEQNYFQGRGGINEFEENLKDVNRKRNNSQTLITDLKDKFNNLKLEFSSIGERLKIEFNITIEEVMTREPNEKLDPEELQIKVDKIKKRLDNYGEINPMAVEAYDEMKQRYDNISTQRDDILEAKKSLLETIKEIEETATAQFMTAFNKVREYFIEAFRSLFSEDDNCDLKLTTPETPLESQIEIIAKPKGKRPLTINQLSGGEKTLTATALLFSLYLLKPAPFCIFDEVDAPLDDANIEKFNKIIRKFSEKSQFIIVTHNKLTMAAVDVIYGVYMQEEGVSGVSPVDFRELDEAPSMVVEA